MKKKALAYGPENRLHLNIIVGLYRAHLRIHRSTQKLVARHGLTMAQFGVLEALYHLGDMTIGDIIDKTLSTSGNMTVVIKNLEHDGWITRRQDPVDRRVWLIQLAVAGRQLIERIFPEHLQDLAGLLDGLTKEEKEQLIGLFKKMNGVQ